MKLQNQKKERKEIAETIIESINNKDIEQMKKLFCDFYQDNIELEWDINDFFDCVDGNIISYELTNIQGESGTTVIDGKIVLDYDNIILGNVKTDEDKIYDIYSVIYWIDDEHKEVEGIVQMTLVLNDEIVYRIAYECEV